MGCFCSCNNLIHTRLRFRESNVLCYGCGEENRVLQDHSELIPQICYLALSRSEEHTSELQSLRHLVCRLLLEKKKQKIKNFLLELYLSFVPLKVNPNVPMRNIRLC